MSIRFEDSARPLSDTLRQVRAGITTEEVTLGELLRLIGEQGLLLFVMFLMTPFLLPVSIPGMSTVFSVIAILVGLGVMMNRIPWLPQRVLLRSVASASLLPALDRAIGLTAGMERFIRPRWPVLTHGASLNRLNGLMIIFAAVLLLMPFVMVPFSNTFPGVAILLLAAGMVQRDGLFVMLGYVMVAVTLVYFAGLGYAVFMLGANLQDLSALKSLLPGH